LYLFAFMAGIVVPKTVDSGLAGPLVPAIIVNTVLPLLSRAYLDAHSLVPGSQPWVR
jgi:hypothetical protein